MAFNRKQKLRDNIEAVRTAFTLDRERRTPTERERALLERYCNVRCWSGTAASEG